MEDKIRQVSDRPAERSLNITNILLGLLILLGGVFGTAVTDSMNRMNDSVDSVEQSIGNLKIVNGVTLNELKHLSETITEHGDRLTKLEEKK